MQSACAPWPQKGKPMAEDGGRILELKSEISVYKAGIERKLDQNGEAKSDLHII